MGSLKAPRVGFAGPGEGLVAEELRFQQRFADRCAVQLFKGPVPAAREKVQSLCEAFLVSPVPPRGARASRGGRRRRRHQGFQEGRGLAKETAFSGGGFGGREGGIGKSHQQVASFATTGMRTQLNANSSF